MKFPMFEKETKDKKYHEDPFRAVNFKIDEVYEKKGNDGYVDDSSDSHWTMVVENGYVTSYTKDETRFNTMGGAYTSDYHSTESYTFSLDWTWEAPDLSSYHNYS